ncbi:hypothetical protein ASG25_09285 [Rhizobium sp. Leaf384]|nr:hypothetical protein ASG25_09285 [Rhizobium sp. Leaf384]
MVSAFHAGEYFVEAVAAHDDAAAAYEPGLNIFWFAKACQPYDTDMLAGEIRCVQSYLAVPAGQ